MTIGRLELKPRTSLARATYVRLTTALGALPGSYARATISLVPDDRNRVRVLRGRGGRGLAVHGVADLGRRIGRTQLQEEEARVRAGLAREDGLVRDVRVSRIIGSARRRHGEVLLLTPIEAVRQVDSLGRKTAAGARAVFMHHLQIRPDQGQVLAVAVEGEVRVVVPRRVSIGPVLRMILLLNSRREDQEESARRDLRPQARPISSGRMDRPSDTSRRG